MDQDLTLLDAGYPGNGRIAAECIEGLRLHVEELKCILITHSHPDHTDSAIEFKALTSIHVLANPSDISLDP